MKETDVKGLEELRQEFDGKLRALPGYEELQAELRKRALDLIRKEIAKKGLTIQESVLPSPTLRGDCGFCDTCITDCHSCVAYH